MLFGGERCGGEAAHHHHRRRRRHLHHHRTTPPNVTLTTSLMITLRHNFMSSPKANGEDGVEGDRAINLKKILHDSSRKFALSTRSMFVSDENGEPSNTAIHACARIRARTRTPTPPPH